VSNRHTHDEKTSPPKSKAHDAFTPWALLVDGRCAGCCVAAYAGTFSAGLVLRSHVTPKGYDSSDAVRP